MAVWILGGGVPKNYTLQGEPLLDQILGVPTHGFDIDVQFCVDPVDNGALSSCPAGEGHTWGKVSAESVATGSVYVHADVTAVFPWLTYALLSDPEDQAQAPPPLRRSRGRGVDAAARSRQATKEAGRDDRLSPRRGELVFRQGGKPKGGKPKGGQEEPKASRRAGEMIWKTSRANLRPHPCALRRVVLMLRGPWPNRSSSSSPR